MPCFGLQHFITEKRAQEKKDLEKRGTQFLEKGKKGHNFFFL